MRTNFLLAAAVALLAVSLLALADAWMDLARARGPVYAAVAVGMLALGAAVGWCADRARWQWAQRASTGATVNDLIAFLLDSLNREEAYARNATRREWVPATPRGRDGRAVITDTGGEVASYAADDWGNPIPMETTDVIHIAHHDPERVLREVAAKRQTVARCREALASGDQALADFAGRTLKEMAEPYREKWRP